MSRTSWGIRALRARAMTRQFRPTVQILEDRCTPAALFRSIDGTGNNAANPDWGSTGEALLRKAGVAYADGIDDPVVGSPARPSPRAISNTIVDQGSADIISDRQLSAMAYAWGQFIDHDMDLTTGANPAEPFNINVPNDPNDPFSTAATPPGPGVIFFGRSEHVPGTGTSTSNPRQQPNDITAFLDGSMVYGSDPVTADALRTHSGGRLKTSPGPDGIIGTADDWLPFNNRTYFPGFHETGGDGTGAFHIANDAHIVSDAELFMAGDIRANENIELTSLHTLFAREHNRIADALHAQNPGMSDETIYQLARRQVGAEIQAITYNEWLPAILGPNALPNYTGYKSNVNPGIANEFSTALFRVGHSMLGDDVEFIANNGTEVREGIALSQAFFNPPELQQQGISPILKYLGSDPSSEIDSTIVNSVRDFLFGPPGAGGFDLAALNIQRGRDHGLANYNAVRVAYGLPAVTKFSQISSNPDIQAKLQQLYGNVNNIDLWVGALAEDHVPGSSTGALIRAGLIDQFKRLRDGDLYFYKNPNAPLPFSAADQAFFENNRSLADLIRLDSGADVIQNNIFFFRVSVSGTVFNDANGNGRQDRGEGGLAGRTVKIFNVNDPANPELVATTTTNSNGHYTFDVFDGLRTGNFRVVEVLPNGWNATTADPRNVNIPRGETFLDVDFGNTRSRFGPTSLGSGGGAAAGSGAPAGLGAGSGFGSGSSSDSGTGANGGGSGVKSAGTSGQATVTAPTAGNPQDIAPIWVDANSSPSTGFDGVLSGLLGTGKNLLSVL